MKLEHSHIVTQENYSQFAGGTNEVIGCIISFFSN